MSGDTCLAAAAAAAALKAALWDNRGGLKSLGFGLGLVDVAGGAAGGRMDCMAVC